MRICNVLKNDFIMIVYCKVFIVKATTCYWPNGSEATECQACNSTVDGADSGCCSSADICTNRGFCISTYSGYMYRGACTNQAWNPDVCFAECLDGAQNGTFDNLYPCPSITGTWARSFCCTQEGGISCCDNQLPSFIDFGQNFAFFPPRGDNSSTASAQSLSLQASSSSISSLPLRSNVNTISKEMLSFSSTTTAFSANGSLVLTTSSCRSPSQSNDRVVLGAAIGVPLGVLLLLALSFLLLMEHRRRKSSEQALNWIHVRDKSKEKAKARERRKFTVNNGPAVFGLGNSQQNPAELHGGEIYEATSHPSPTRYDRGIAL